MRTSRRFAQTKSKWFEVSLVQEQKLDLVIYSFYPALSNDVDENGCGEGELFIPSSPLIPCVACSDVIVEKKNVLGLIMWRSVRSLSQDRERRVGPHVEKVSSKILV